MQIREIEMHNSIDISYICAKTKIYIGEQYIVYA